MGLSTTHTYVILEVSQQTYDEIKRKLEKAGYHHTFMPDGEIDMHGIAVKAVAGSIGTYYYGARLTSDCPLDHYRPYVYRRTVSNSLYKEMQNYLGDPLPSLEDATDAAQAWAEERGLEPLELE